MQGKREAFEALRQHIHQPLGIRLQLESNDKVVSEANNEALALHTRLDRLYEPVVQHIVQRVFQSNRRSLRKAIGAFHVQKVAV